MCHRHSAKSYRMPAREWLNAYRNWHWPWTKWISTTIIKMTQSHLHLMQAHSYACSLTNWSTIKQQLFKQLSKIFSFSFYWTLELLALNVDSVPCVVRHNYAVGFKITVTQSEKYNDTSYLTLCKECNPIRWWFFLCIPSPPQRFFYFTEATFHNHMFGYAHASACLVKSLIDFFAALPAYSKLRANWPRNRHIFESCSILRPTKSSVYSPTGRQVTIECF